MQKRAFKIELLCYYSAFFLYEIVLSCFASLRLLPGVHLCTCYFHGCGRLGSSFYTLFSCPRHISAIPRFVVEQSVFRVLPQVVLSVPGSTDCSTEWPCGWGQACCGHGECPSQLALKKTSMESHKIIDFRSSEGSQRSSSWTLLNQGSELSEVIRLGSMSRSPDCKLVCFPLLNSEILSLFIFRNHSVFYFPCVQDGVVVACLLS